MLSFSTPADLAAFRAALIVLLSPFDYPDTTAWRQAAAGVIRASVGADTAMITLRVNGEAVMAGVNLPSQQALQTYADYYHHKNPGDRRRLAMGLTHWTREQLLPASEFRRTEYFTDYCAINALIDSCGMSTPIPGPRGSEAVMHITTERGGRFAAGGREDQILELLQPAFAAGVRSALLGATWQTELRRELDAGAAGIAICDPKGRLLHATPRLLQLVQEDPEGSRILSCISRISVDIGALLRRRNESEPTTPPGRTVQTRLRRYTVCASLLRTPELLGQTPLVMLIIDAATPPVSPSRSQLRARFNLTERESEVAILLANGARNRDIARRIGVTDHTARRHTEHVLTKLGVTSRAAVASAIRGGTTLASDHTD